MRQSLDVAEKKGVLGSGFIPKQHQTTCNANSNPFLRMPNVHVEPGPAGSPTPEEIIVDTKNGVLIDGRGSYSIDQQRYNGQFGGNASGKSKTASAPAW